MYLRDEQHLQGYGGTPTLVQTVEKAIGFYKQLNDLFTGGGFQSQTSNAKYIKEPLRPDSVVLKCTRWFRIVTYEDDRLTYPKRRRDMSFNFKLEYEYDGINLIEVRLVTQEKGSSAPNKDKFKIS